RNGWEDGQNAQDIGRTLFKLLIPLEMDSFLSGSSEIQIELDTGTAGIPWELLDSGADDEDDNPWAIRAKLLRRLRTPDFRLQPRDASVEDGILIIGEPQCDTKIYPRLPAARREALGLQKLLLDTGVRTESLCALVSADENQVGPDACKVVKTLITGN